MAASIVHNPTIMASKAGHQQICRQAAAAGRLPAEDEGEREGRDGRSRVAPFSPDPPSAGPAAMAPGASAPRNTYKTPTSSQRVMMLQAAAILQAAALQAAAAVVPPRTD